MKKLFVLMLSSVLVAMLVSCAYVPAVTPAAKPEEPIKLVAWAYNNDWTKSYEYLRTHLDEFKRMHPNATVEFVEIPYADYEAKYLTAFAGRVKAPDIFQGKVAYYAGSVGVGEEFPEDIQKILNDNVIDVIAPFYKVNGKWYGVPISADLGMMLYYNKDMFIEAGLDPNRPPKTMDELLEYAKKLTKYDAAGKIARSGFAIRYSGAPIGIADKALPFVHAFGGRLYSPDGKTATGFIDSPGTVAGLQFLQDLALKHKVASLELGKPEEQFAAGKAAMIFRESWLVGWLRTNAPTINYGVAPMPEGPAGYPGLSLLFSHSWMVYKYGPHKDIAMDWLRTYLTPEVDWDLAQLEGYLPVFKSNMARPEITERPDWSAIQHIMSHPTGPYYDDPYINEISTVVGTVVQAILQGTDPKEALTKAADDINKLLAKKY